MTSFWYWIENLVDKNRNLICKWFNIVRYDNNTFSYKDYIFTHLETNSWETLYHWKWKIYYLKDWFYKYKDDEWIEHLMNWKNEICKWNNIEYIRDWYFSYTKNKTKYLIEVKKNKWTDK